MTKIPLKPEQEKAFDRRVEAVNKWARAAQEANVHHAEALNSLKDLIAFVAAGKGIKDYDFQRTEVKDGELILKEKDNGERKDK